MLKGMQQRIQEEKVQEEDIFKEPKPIELYRGPTLVQAESYFVRDSNVRGLYDLDATTDVRYLGGSVIQGDEAHPVLRRGTVTNLGGISTVMAEMSGIGGGVYANVPGAFSVRGPGVGRPVLSRASSVRAVEGEACPYVEHIGISDSLRMIMAKRTLKQESLASSFKKARRCAACDPNAVAGGGLCTCGQNLYKRRK